MKGEELCYSTTIADNLTDLLLAVRAASRGEIYLNPTISGSLVAGFLTVQTDADGSNPFERLTPREREVLQLISEGHTNKAIAQILKVSPKTVEKHRSNLMSKLNVRDLAGLMRSAIRHGLVLLDK